MNYTEYKDEANGVLIQISCFTPDKGSREYHLILKGTDPAASFIQQLSGLTTSYQFLLLNDLKEAVPVFLRYFLSDAANQAQLISQSTYPECMMSVIGQAPLNGCKIALWAVLQTGIEHPVLENGLSKTSHNGYCHLWGSATPQDKPDVELQTMELFQQYIEQLKNENCTLAHHCLRTWFFIDNIDVNYSGMVESRNKVFAQQGLTEETHSIASTGIYGRNENANVLVQLDTYAVKGIEPEQIQYLYAPTHLNPTHEYGVSFERGTSIQYGDRKQVFISGTASIDNTGEILWPGDIQKQTLRMWENVGVLLEEAGCQWNDVAQMIIYLRDPADSIVVKNLFEEKFPHVPKLIVLAPVCREGWLIEMECIALKAIEDKRFRDF